MGKSHEQRDKIHKEFSQLEYPERRTEHREIETREEDNEAKAEEDRGSR